MINSLADPGDGTCTPSECTLREEINDPASTEISDTPPVARFSLIGNGEGSGLEGQHGVNANQLGTSSAPIFPRLGPLEFNGGPTRTYALLLGSPAIDRRTLEGCPARDQRGVRRPRGLTCDIGSYERVQQTKTGG